MMKIYPELIEKYRTGLLKEILLFFSNTDPSPPAVMITYEDLKKGQRIEDFGQRSKLIKTILRDEIIIKMSVIPSDGNKILTNFQLTDKGKVLADLIAYTSLREDEHQLLVLYNDLYDLCGKKIADLFASRLHEGESPQVITKSLMHALKVNLPSFKKDSNTH